MQWFAGNVQTAIQISRKNRALLIVYISTDSEDGQLFDGFWNNVDTANLLCPVVGIKLKAGEVPAQQFADIYPTPIVPAAYLIDLNGKPLEVITTLVGKEYDQFRSKFDRGVSHFLNGQPEKVPEAPQQAPAAPVHSEPVQTSSDPPKAAIDSELAEKVKRAKELLEIKKQKDLKAKKEAEKREKEEIQKAQVAHQQREDKALLEAAKQRKKEKMDAEKEKERILEQIKQDRENALKRFGNAQNAVKTEEKLKGSGDSNGKSVPSDRCRLQVRLPDGSTFVEEFPSEDVLNSLVEIIRQKIGGNFEISQPYPRRVFSTDDYSKTYLENNLTPSTALVVILKPTTSSAVIAKSSSIFSLILSPIWLIWNVFSNFIGWNNSQNSRKKEEGSSGSTGAVRSRGMPRSAEVRRRGNIAGLQNHNDDDPEERASFNGNSTQFM